MKKNIKAIIAALSASIMCAVPVAASFASTTAVTSITAEATDDYVRPVAHLWDNLYIDNGVTYTITGNKAVLHGRWDQISEIIMADKIEYNGVEYKVTEVRAGAFKNAHTTATGSGVRKFRCGKYVTKIGDEAFRYSSVSDVTFGENVKEIGNYAFAYTNIGTSVYLSGKLETIRAHAFEGCDKIKYFTIDGGISINGGFNDNDRVVSIGSRAFAGTTALRRFEIYRNTIKANGTDDPDYSVFQGTNPDFKPNKNIGGNVYGVPKFRHLFFAGY